MLNKRIFGISFCLFLSLSLAVYPQILTAGAVAAKNMIGTKYPQLMYTGSIASRHTKQQTIAGNYYSGTIDRVNADSDIYFLISPVSKDHLNQYDHSNLVLNSAILLKQEMKPVNVPLLLSNLSQEKEENRFTTDLLYFAGAAAAAVIVYMVWPEKETPPKPAPTFGLPITPNN